MKRQVEMGTQRRKETGQLERKRIILGLEKLEKIGGRF